MFAKLKNRYFKYKFKSRLQDRLISAINEEQSYLNRISEWKNKVHDVTKMTEARFNETKSSQIKWSYEMYRAANIKVETIKSIIKDLEEMKYE